MQGASECYADVWKNASDSLEISNGYVFLKLGAAKWMWVVRKLEDRWQVSLWGGDLYWLRLDGLKVKPDLDAGRPVVRWIGNGCLAQYYRFERPEVLQ